MNEGLLWYDGDPKKALSEKIAQAAARYQHKYGRKPNLCYVNPLMLPGNGPAEYGGVRIEPMRNVLKHHFWIGVDDERIPV
jgi:hypothetical protein